MPVYSTNYKCLVISIASAVVGILGNPKHVLMPLHSYNPMELKKVQYPQ